MPHSFYSYMKKICKALKVANLNRDRKKEKTTITIHKILKNRLATWFPSKMFPKCLGLKLYCCVNLSQSHNREFPHLKTHVNMSHMSIV